MDSNHCSKEELKQFLAVVNYDYISSMNDALPRTVTDWSSYRNLMMDLSAAFLLVLLDIVCYSIP